jgi:hypothetical protein
MENVTATYNGIASLSLPKNEEQLRNSKLDMEKYLLFPKKCLISRDLSLKPVIVTNTIA